MPLDWADEGGGACTKPATGRQGFFRGISGSVVGAAVLLFWDIAIGGTYITSILVCPIWFLVSLVKSGTRRSDPDLDLLRIGIPALTLGLVLANSAVQVRVAEANAARVVAACEAYHATNGSYPEKLAELVPQYLPSVPRAKYCLGMWGEFRYSLRRGKPVLLWYVVPPFGRKYYDFETRCWYHIE